jgi:hypothetical protein
MKPVQIMLASALVAGSLWTMGCNQAPTTNEAPPPPRRPAPSSPAAAPSSMAPSAAPSAAVSSPAAAPSTAPSAATGSPVSEKAPPPVGMERYEYNDAGVEISVPANMSTPWEKLQGGEWMGSMTPDKKMLVLVRAEEWKEWSDILKACDDLLKDFKSEGEPKEDKTVDGIKFWFDTGSATINNKTYFVFVAGYDLQDHDFVLVIAGDPSDKGWIPMAQKVVASVTRQSKYQNTDGEEKGDEGKSDEKSGDE